jgi:hypothetical protein
MPASAFSEAGPLAVCLQTKYLRAPSASLSSVRASAPPEKAKGADRSSRNGGRIILGTPVILRAIRGRAGNDD